MGTTSSKKKYDVPASFYGDIFTKIDKGSYFSGETLTGQIYLNLKNPYPGNKLFLSFKGFEFATWVDIPSQDDNRHEPIRKKQKLKIFKQENEVYQWSDGPTTSPGQYVFPFQFIIPPRLPGSFSFSEAQNKVNSEIRYTVTAFLKPDKEDTIAKLKHRTVIVLKEVPQMRIETQEMSLDKRLACCCGCGCGAISMKTRADKNAYAPSETVKVVSEINCSHSKAQVDKVHACIIQRIYLRAENYGKKIDLVIDSRNLGKIKPREQNLFNTTIDFQLPPAQEEAAFNSNKPSNKPQGTAKVPFISPSTNGTLVKSEFFIHIMCDTGCFITLPTTELPIFIYAPVMTGMADPVPPVNWAPQRIEPVNLAFNAEFYLGHAPTVVANNQVSYNQMYQGPMAQM